MIDNCFNDIISFNHIFIIFMNITQIIGGIDFFKNYIKFIDLSFNSLQIFDIFCC